MNILDIKEKVIVIPGDKNTDQERKRLEIAEAAREPVGPLDGGPLSPQEKARVRALLDSYSTTPPTIKEENIGIGQAFFREFQRERDVDAATQAAREEQRAQRVAIGRNPGQEQSSTQDKLAQEVSNELKSVDWSKIKREEGMAPDLDPKLYDKLDQLSKKDFERAAGLWEAHTPPETITPAFIDRRFRSQLDELAKVTSQISEEEKRKDAALYDQEVRQRLEKMLEQRKADRSNSLSSEDAFNDLSAKPQATRIPNEIKDSYTRVGNRYIDSSDPKRAFEDKGNKLETNSNSEKIAGDLVRTAEARGWTTIRVEGTPDFKKQVWLDASLHGMEVKGYKPTEADRKELAEKQIATKNKEAWAEKANDLRNMPAKDAVKKHPDLVAAYAIIRAAREVAETRVLTKKGQDEFVALTKETLAKQIESGKQIPQVKTRMNVVEQRREQAQELGR